MLALLIATNLLTSQLNSQILAGILSAAQLATVIGLFAVLRRRKRVQTHSWNEQYQRAMYVIWLSVLGQSVFLFSIWNSLTAGEDQAALVANIAAGHGLIACFIWTTVQAHFCLFLHEMLKREAVARHDPNEIDTSHQTAFTQQ